MCEGQGYDPRARRSLGRGDRAEWVDVRVLPHLNVEGDVNDDPEPEPKPAQPEPKAAQPEPKSAEPGRDLTPAPSAA
jgi:hypothetical protein